MKLKLKPILKDYDEWLERSLQKRFYEEAVERLQLFVAKGSVPPGESLAHSLWKLTTRLATLGLSKVGHGNGGWEELACCCAYKGWQERYLMLQSEVDLQLGKSPSPSLLPVLYGVFVFGDSESTEVLMRKVNIWSNPSASKLQSAISVSSDDPSRFLWSFVLSIIAAYQHGATPRPPLRFPDLGPYAPLIAAWDQTGPAFDAAMIAACDYHIERTADNDEDIGEFCGTPYNYLPLEYLALRRLRRSRGLDTPKPKHQLLDLPFADLPEPPPKVEDPLFNSVVATMRKLYPGI